MCLACPLTMWTFQATQRMLPHQVTMFLTCQSCRIRGKMTTMMILHLQLHQLHQILLRLLHVLRLVDKPLENVE